MLARLLLLAVSLACVAGVMKREPRRNLDLVFDGPAEDQHIINAIRELSKVFSVKQLPWNATKSCTNLDGSTLPRIQGDLTVMFQRSDNNTSMRKCSEEQVCRENYAFVTYDNGEILTLSLLCHNQTKQVKWDGLIETLKKKHRPYTVGTVPDEYINVDGANDKRFLYAIIAIMGLSLIAMTGMLGYSSMNHQKQLKKSNEFITEDQKHQRDASAIHHKMAK